MSVALIRSGELYAWRGPSLLVVDSRGECGAHHALSGYYFREARFLCTLRLEINGTSPWLCEAVMAEPHVLEFTYVHPELMEFGGGGSGQSGDEISTDSHGIPHRALALRLTYSLAPDHLTAVLCISNHSTRPVEFDCAWLVDADFADIQEAHQSRREQEGGVRRDPGDRWLALGYDHPQLKYRTSLSASGDPSWTIEPSSFRTHLHLDPQQTTRLQIIASASDEHGSPPFRDGVARDKRFAAWHGALATVSIPSNRVSESILRANIRDLASFALLDGTEDEWLTLQAGMPLYPALFGRDTLTAGWQTAFLDRGESLEASLTRLGRMQSQRHLAWRDEEPGRIPYQVRRGPLALLDLNPYAAYYADFASPLMFVISLTHLYSWRGDKRCIEPHWDVARRILDWAAAYGDADRDGYLEYETRSSKGTKNQGWKDSGDAIVYDDGRPVPAPLGTCELQGYWYAARQCMAALSVVMGAYADAKAFWREASDLKERFNRDWWNPSDASIVLALDRDKRKVSAVTSNIGHCVAAGIVSDEHLPSLVGRLFESDMFSGWGIRTLSARHRAYNPLSYHLGSVWAVEQATIAFGLRRFGFDVRALEIAEALFDLAGLYPGYRIPECIGGFARRPAASPGAYPRANAPQLWNASAFPLLVHTIVGLQPVAALDTLFVAPCLPTWLPEITIRDVRMAGATATVRFWRDRSGESQAEIVHKQGTLRLVKQPPPESLSAGVTDRFRGLLDTIRH